MFSNHGRAERCDGLGVLENTYSDDSLALIAGDGLAVPVVEVLDVGEVLALEGLGENGRRAAFGVFGFVESLEIEGSRRFCKDS